ncbi:hypothetical protein BDP81DRAFT_210765 [Colletotrichum phormii]|uniref:Uncharacterized protein n=1 Tax=Colletotrichum phormii TaxID=359342 RepID=A0AAI9ZSU4_9PEZI|nr:uncharacterized protein BDP81DRAFT_210765 [Colletotrichum phormii]KAK1637531.1 hypothetical protein BDP81DRAFT_210765 [Colletotrichum phormii]
MQPPGFGKQTSLRHPRSRPRSPGPTAPSPNPNFVAHQVLFGGCTSVDLNLVEHSILKHNKPTPYDMMADILPERPPKPPHFAHEPKSSVLGPPEQSISRKMHFSEPDATNPAIAHRPQHSQPVI